MCTTPDFNLAYTGVGFSFLSEQHLGLSNKVALEVDSGGIDDGGSEINTLEANGVRF